MGRADPFFAYSLLLRTIIFGFIPALTIVQYFRLKRGCMSSNSRVTSGSPS